MQLSGKVTEMKKIIILIMAAFLLTACSPSVPKDPPLIKETVTTAETPPADTPETTPEDTAAIPEDTTIASEDTTVSEPEAVENPSGAAIAALAEEQLEVPFATGGSSPEAGFDNPGLISYVLNKLGITAGRTVSELSKLGSSVDFAELQIGDLVFFSSEEAGEAPSFGGIYIGDGNMIYAPVPDDVVKSATITSQYWSKRFVTAQRVGVSE